MTLNKNPKESQVEIEALKEYGYTIHEISNMYGVSTRCISKIYQDANKSEHSDSHQKVETVAMA